MLIDAETHCLAPRLRGVLQGMRGAVPKAAADLESTTLEQGLQDADWFLTVAISLLNGKDPKGGPARMAAVDFSQDFGREASALGNDARVGATLAMVEGEQLANCEMFGTQLLFDFSQFKPRGHYEKSPALRRYFRAFMWCGRTVMPMGGGEDGRDTRGLGCALALLHLLQESGHFEGWEVLEDTLAAFVGEADSMTFRQLDAVVRQYCSQAGVQTLKELREVHSLSELLVLIKNAGLGKEAICSSVVEDSSRNPPAFTFSGQKFIMDSWAMSNSVYDRIAYNGKKVPHIHPSCLDVCFSVLGNDSVVPQIVNRVKESKLPFHSSLAAIRAVFDALEEKTWRKSLYALWLRLLRTLSTPTTDDQFPEAMRTRAWAAKTAETQAASWAQLRHDTILYAKQSYGCCGGCEYPAGYVEPRPDFWAAFLDMIGRVKEILLNGAVGDGPEADLIEKAKRDLSCGKRNISQVLSLRHETRYCPRPAREENSTLEILRKQITVMERWEDALLTIHAIAKKELRHHPMNKAETEFLKKVVRKDFGGSGPPRYNGWYCGLFYKSAEDSCERDVIVADVHTQPPGDMDPEGFVLHQGVSLPALMTIAVNTGPDLAVYVGPVFSHHEFELKGVHRLSDSEWNQRVRSGDLPAAADWKTFIAAS
ncbi:unnamed protein product [Ostreobium quekettii]|uniref:Uncharacterized protein n=1 Tax=Ostreobium quekettii TaxID=121088 RepID=A0A8S1J5X1_9CHLO|nr:unnamed protein product [Ostreobium quekettii]